MISKKKIDRIIKNDPDLAENFLQDNNNISLLVQINAAIQILKLLVIIINLTIVVGSLIYIIFYIINEAKQHEF
jgi:Na+/melibiose symporter-like transporter